MAEYASEYAKGYVAALDDIDQGLRGVDLPDFFHRFTRELAHLRTLPDYTDRVRFWEGGAP